MNNIEKINKKILIPLLGIPEIKNSGYWYKCPFCNGYHKPHKKLVVDVEHGGRFHCWVCDAKGGKFFHLLKKLKAPKKYFDILEELSGEIIDFVKENQEFVELPENTVKLLDMDDRSIMKKIHTRYLKGRGISHEDMMRYNVMITKNNPEFEDRIIIPSYDENFNLNYYVTRDITGTSKIKYKNPSVSKNIVFFENLINWQEPIIIVEGVFDAMAVRDNAIPLLGKFVLSNLKKKLMENKTKVIYVALDPDAYDKMITIANELKNSYNKVFIVDIPNGEDCGSLGYKKVWEYIYKAKEFSKNTMMLNILTEKNKGSENGTEKVRKICL